MPLPRRRSPESSRRRRREKRQSREDLAAASIVYSPESITPQQMLPGTYSADSPRQSQQPYPPPQQQPPYQPYQQQQQQQQQQLYQQQYPESFPQQTSQPMPPRQTPPHGTAEPRSRASSGSLSSSPSSSSSSYLEITRQYPLGRYGGFLSTFLKAPSEVRRRRRRRGSGTKKRRGVFFGGSNSSHSSINSDMAYGTGFVKKEKDQSTRYSSSVAGSAVSGSQSQRQPQQQPYYPAAGPNNKPSPKVPGESKRDKTDEEIIAIGRQLSNLARRSNEEDLRAAGKSRPSGLASTAAAISALRKSRKEAKKRGLTNSKKHRESSSDESDWESASDDDDDSSDSSSSDDSALHLAYGGYNSSRSNHALPEVVGAAAAGVMAASVASSNPTHSRKSSVVDPRLFGPVNSLRGLVSSPCGFGDEPQPPSASSARHSRYDLDRPATGGSQADAARRPGSIPLEQPIPKVPVSNKVFEAGRRDSRNSYRRKQSGDASLDPTLGGGVAAAAAAAAARMADRRGPWTEDRIYRDDVKLTRPDPDEDHFERDQAPFEELERRRANPEVYYNRRDDDVDSPRLESNRQMPDYSGRDSSDLPRESRSWMELHPQERKESLQYQTTYDAHMREQQMREAQRRNDQPRDAQPRDAQPRDAQRQQQEQQQQQQQQQTARATKAGDRNPEEPVQPIIPNPIVDPFQYQVADDAFNTPEFNTPRRPLTPQVVTVNRVPNFANPKPAPVSAPPASPPSMQVQPQPQPQTHSDVRLSRKDSFEIERAAEERRRGGQSSESRGRDPRSRYEYEQEEKEARSILDEAKHSTIPVAAVAVAPAIAVEEERSRERRRREYSDDGSRDRSIPPKDAVQEDADRYYRVSVIARKIASDEIRSRSRSPDESVVDKWEKPQAEESFAIVTPPNMEEREHDDDNNPYAPPNADVKIDNEIYPHETGQFRAANGLDASRFRPRESSRERPLLNIVRPTPVPSPDSTSAAAERSQPPSADVPDVPVSREVEVEPESHSLADSSEDEEPRPRGDEATHSSPSGKSVSWGENSTKRFEVESPEARSRAESPAESPNELAETEDKPRPRLSKMSQWGKIAAMMASGTAEPTTELDRSTASRSRHLPADDDVNGAAPPPVPGPKPASPAPEQMPGTFADDLEFTATVAAGLEESGFDPNIVIDDPAFRRRDSRPGTNETPVMGHAVPEKPAEAGAVTLPPPADDIQRDEPRDAPARRRSREVEEVEDEELSLTDTEDEQDEKAQKQARLNALEKYLQMRQSGEIKPPAQSQEPVPPPAVQDRPVTPPQKSNNEQRIMLEKFLQRRQSGEIQPPREVLEAAESRSLEPLPEVQDEESKKGKMERLEKFLQMRQSRQPEEPEAVAEAGPKHESDPEQPQRRTLDPEALRELEDSVSDFASSNKSKKKKKKKKRRDRQDELSTVSSRFDDDNSRLSIPGDEGTELSRVSAPGDEGSDLRTVYSVEDWEDWDSSPRSTRRSLVASELSTASRRSTRSKRRSISEKELGEIDEAGDGHVDDRGVSSVISEPYDDDRKPRSREKKSSRYNDNSEKSRKRVGSGKKPGFFSGIFHNNKSSGGKTESNNEKRDSFFEQAGTLGAGAGLASITALSRSNAADVSSDPENISRELPGSGREFEDHYPVIAPRAIAIDPQYGDLLPLPPSEPGSPVVGSFDELPCLPDSRPATPIEDRNRRFEKTHRRQRSNQENLANSRNRSYSNTAVPLALLRGIGSGPTSPIAFKQSRTPPRPTSWDSTKEFMPLMLLERARRGSSDNSLEGEDLPPLPPSEVESEAESPALRPADDFRRRPVSSDPDDDAAFDLADERRLRLQTDIPAASSTAVTDVASSEGSTPKADLKHELPVPSTTDNAIGEAAARYEYSLPSPTTPPPTRRLSPQPNNNNNKDLLLHRRAAAEELTSADEQPSDDFETARTSPADMHDEDLYEPELPPIEPSMLGAIPEFSRPAKFFEDKVPEHSEQLASVDKVIETLPSIESVPRDHQARQGSPDYYSQDSLSDTADEESSNKKGKQRNNKSLFSVAQPTADETIAAFVDVPEPVAAAAKDSSTALDYEYISPTELVSKEKHDYPVKERSKAKSVTVEDEPEEPEHYTTTTTTTTPGPDVELDTDKAAMVWEPLDEDVVEDAAPAPPVSETVDIIPVTDELYSDAVAAEVARHADPEVVEEIIIGTLPHSTSRSAPHGGAPATTTTEVKTDPSTTVIEDSDDLDEEEETDEDEEEDSDDSEESEEDSEEEDSEEEDHHVEAVAKHVGGEEEGHAVRDMTASVETLGAASVVSTGSKKSKKKKKKKKKRKRKKKKSKSAAAAATAAAAAAAAAAATVAAEASRESPMQQHATESTESTESTVLPVVEPVTEAAPEVTRDLPADLDRREAEHAVESPIQPVPADAVDVVEESRLDLAQDAAPESAPADTVDVEESRLDLAQDVVALEPAPEASEQLTRDIVEEPIVETPQEAATSIEPSTSRDISEPISESIARSEGEELPSLPDAAVEGTNNDVEDGLLKWAAADSEPIPHSDHHVEGDRARAISPELSGENDGEKERVQAEDESETIAPQEELPVIEDLTSETPADVAAEEESDDTLVEDREAIMTDETAPSPEEMTIESPSATEELTGPGIDNSIVSDAESPSTNRELAVAEDEEQDSEQTMATPEYEQTMPLPFQELPTIMEEPGLEEANAAEGQEYAQPEFEEDADFNKQLSPILEESLEDLLEESSEQMGQQTKELEPIAEEAAPALSEAVIAPEDKDISPAPTMEESLSRSIINEMGETAGSKDAEWAPPVQLPSFASDISEPLFTQGDAPSEYPTQLYPGSFESTEMEESFVVPEEPSRTPPPPPTADAFEPATDDLEPVKVDESFVVPEEPSRTPPPPPTADAFEPTTDGLESTADAFESRADALESTTDAFESTTDTLEATDALEPAKSEEFVVPEEPSRTPPPPPPAYAPPPPPSDAQTEAATTPLDNTDGVDNKVDELESAVAPVESGDNVTAPEHSDKPDETREESANVIPSAEEAEPTKQEHETEVTLDEESANPPSLEVDQTPADILPETRELAPTDGSQKNEEPATDDIVPSHTAPELTELPEENLPVTSDLAPEQSELSPVPTSEEESKTQDDKSIEESSGPGLEVDAAPQQDQSEDAKLPKPDEAEPEAKEMDSTPLEESETIPPQELDQTLESEPKLEQEADDTNSETGDKSREVNADVTESDLPLETGPYEDSQSVPEEEHRPGMEEDNDNVNLDGEKEEDKTDNSGQPVEADPTTTLDPSVETSLPQESNMTSELEQPTLEAEIEAPPVTPPNVDDKMEPERLLPTEESEPVTEAKDGSTGVDEPLAQDSPESQEAQPQTDREPAHVAEDLSQFETPAEVIKEDALDTTLTSLDPATDANDVVVDEALSDPTDVVESAIPETTHDVAPAVEDEQVSDDALAEEQTAEEQAPTDLQPEVLDVVPDAADNEPKLEEPQSESTLELPQEETPQELQSLEPEPESTEEPEKEREPESREVQVEPAFEEGHQESTPLEPEQDPASETLDKETPSESKEVQSEQAFEEHQESTPKEPEQEPSFETEHQESTLREPEQEPSSEDLDKEKEPESKEVQLQPTLEEEHQEPTPKEPEQELASEDLDKETPPDSKEIQKPTLEEEHQEPTPRETELEPALEAEPQEPTPRDLEQEPASEDLDKETPPDSAEIQEPTLEEGQQEPEVTELQPEPTPETQEEAATAATADEVSDPQPFDSTTEAVNERNLDPEVLDKEADVVPEVTANPPASDVAQTEAQPTEPEALPEPSVATEAKTVEDTTPADVEQLPPTEPSEGISKELTEKSQEPADPLDSEARQPTPLAPREGKPQSIHLAVPENADALYSESEFDDSSDDDYDASTVISDTASLRGDPGKFRFPRPNEGTVNLLTGFEVTPYHQAEQHAHRPDRHRKKKKKKGKKHKRKKSKAGSDISSSLTSLSESVAGSSSTLNTNLEGGAPKPPVEITVSEPISTLPGIPEKAELESREPVASDAIKVDPDVVTEPAESDGSKLQPDNTDNSQRSIPEELVNKEEEQSPNTEEVATVEPAPAVAEALEPVVDDSNQTSSPPQAEQQDAEKPESTSRQDEPAEGTVVTLPQPDTIAEEAAADGTEELQPQESAELPDDKAVDVVEKDVEMQQPPQESENANSGPINEPTPDNRDIPSAAAPAPPQDEPENAWDLFTSNWDKSKNESGNLETSEPAQDNTDNGQMIKDTPLVDEPSEMSTPQRRHSQTEQQISANIPTEHETDSQHPDERTDSGLQSEQRDQSPNSKAVRPDTATSQGSEKSNQWFGSIFERFGNTKKKTKDKDKGPVAGDKEDPKDQSFLGSPASRKSGDERSWETNHEQMIDDFLHGGDGPTTPKRPKKRQDQAIIPTTPKRSESITELRNAEIDKEFIRGDIFGGELVESPGLEAVTGLPESPGPFELLRRTSQVDNPISGLLREASASQISVLPPMDMSELSDYDLSDYRLSPPRALPAVEELPEAEAEATASEVGFYRDSGFSGSNPSRSRRHSTNTMPLEDDEEKLRDSGIDGGDWVEAAMAKLKTPEPAGKVQERQPKRRLRRSTLGSQRLRDSTSLRDAAAQDPERKTIPGTRERVLTGTGTRPETPTGRSSPTRKGYGAIAGMGIASRLSNGRASPTPASKDRSGTPPAPRRSVTSPPVAGPLRSLRRAVSAQIGPGLQRPESPSLMPLPTEPQPQPRSVSDSHIPSATKQRQTAESSADPARPDPSHAPRSPPNSGLVRQRTPERLKISHPADAVSGSTVRSSSNPTPPLLRRADKRAGGDLRSLRQQNTSSASISEAPVANEGRVRAKEKTDVYDGYGEGRIGSPLSPTRPHSMRRRQSMQVLELEARVEQLIAENRLLSDARQSTEQHLSHRVVTALSDRDTQIESLKQTLKFLRGEVSRLTEVNDGLTSANAELANKDNSRYADLQVHADRGGNQDALMKALHEKDAQIADLTAKLDAAKEKIRELQRQILESKAADVQFLNIKDEDYFDHRCQQLCSHVQQWVLRFSKFSDMRACRLTSEINDEKIIDRLDNAVLDGSDVDRYLNDRVRRRDIFMSMTMNMIWEFVFTRYLFGMDREQRQKLKSLEKLLTEVGPTQAVRQWRAVTLTLLSKRDSFKRQRDLDTEAVVQAIYQTLCKVLPPPSNLEAQIQAQLRRVMHEAVHLSIEMRTQKAEYMMLPPLQPEYDADGELVQTVQFNASMMNERSGSLKLTNEELEARGAIVRVVLFPLVVKKGDDDGSNDEEIVVCPAQVLIARSKLTRQPTPSTDGGRVSATGTGRLSGGTNSPDTRVVNAI